MWLPTIVQDLLHQKGITECNKLKNMFLLYLQEQVKCKGLWLHKNFKLLLPDPQIINRACQLANRIIIASTNKAMMKCFPSN